MIYKCGISATKFREETMKRIISILLCVAMVLSSVLMMVACGGDTTGGTETKKPVSDIGDDGTDGAKHNVPKQDFDGEAFHSFVGSLNTAKYYYFTDEEAAGDPIKEALWQRTELIKDQLNCELTHEFREDSISISSILNDQVIAGTDEFQQVLMHPIYGVSSLVVNGQAYDFAALPNVDLTAEWWDLDDMEDLRVGKYYVYGRSDFMISAPHVVIFNKTMVDDLNLDNVYDLVNNGTWTVDAMISMSKAAAKDTNNDGKYMPFEDIFGIALSEISKFNSFLISCDQPISQKNDEGRLEIVLNTEKTVKIVEKFYDLWTTNGAVYVAADNMGYGVNHEQLFGEGRSLFVIHDLSILESFRDYEIDTGIAPYPKYDEAQAEYQSMDWGPMWAIPATITNPELVGAVVELYSYYSADTIVPAYYDKVLEGRLSQDKESWDMLELIFDSVSFDPVNNYFGFHSGIGDLAFVIGKLVIEGNSKNFASFYKGRANSAQSRLDEFYKNCEKNGRL